MRFTKPLCCSIGAFSCTAVCRGFAVLQLSYGSELNSFLVMINDSKTNGRHLIFRPYVVRNGKVIYPKNGRMLAFWVED